MRITFEDGIVREVEGLDINIWNADEYGDGNSHGVVVTAYPMRKDAEGFWETDTLGPLVFSAETNLDPEVWGGDEWYGWDEDVTNRDFPAEVYPIVANILKEIVQS